MISNLDIYRSASVLVRQHGEHAPIEAAKRTDQMLRAGDEGGYAVWRWIMKAADELLNRSTPPGATLH